MSKTAFRTDHHHPEQSRGTGAEPFINDVEPYLFGRPITYVDVGAHVGDTFKQLLNSSIKVRDAHLIEPNPTSFRVLNAATFNHANVKRVRCHNAAVSSSAGTLMMRDAGDMTRVLTQLDKVSAEETFEVRSVTLDELAQACGLDQIDLLKIDVEGHELAVLEGSRSLLRGQRINLVYIEAGFDPESVQQTYYRKVEDFLRCHEYRVFGIYEKINEWPRDSPLLRRVNLAFMSTAFAGNNPYKISRALLDVSLEKASLEEKFKAADATLALERTEKEKLSNQVSTYEAQLRSAKQELSTVSLEKASLEEKFKAADATLALARTEKEKLSNQVSKYEAQLLSARQELSIEKVALEGLRSQFGCLPTISELSRELGERFRETAILTAQLDRSEQSVIALKEQFQKLQDERNKLTVQLDRSEQSVIALKEQFQKLQDERNKLRQERDKLAQERSNLSQQRDALLQSASWRITSPVRALVHLLRLGNK